MPIKFSRRWFLGACTIAFPAGLCGCGTVLHPERIGQTRGSIDWRIAALNGAGLLLFFVPGVIAFAVDFYNGTIFLPPEDYEIAENNRPELVSVRVPREDLNRKKIEALVADHTGKQVKLSARSLHTEDMTDIKQFWSRLSQLKDATPRAI